MLVSDAAPDTGRNRSRYGARPVSGELAVSGWAASAPLRADLAGGTLDLWPLYLLHENSSTVNVALDLRARATYQPGGRRWELRAGDHGARRRLAASALADAANESRDGDPFALVLRVLAHTGLRQAGRLTTTVDGPPGGGIGGSSALLVALYGLACRAAGGPLRRQELPSLARDLEAQVLGFPTGVQDYYPAIYGGALQLHYRPGETRMERLPVDLEALERRLMLVYSGQPHASAPSNWRLYRRRIEGDPTARDGFEAIARAAVAAGEALRQGDWRALGRAMTADWKARQGIDPTLAPPDLRRLERAGLEAGAAAAKGCGAASGGCMLFLLRDPADRQTVTAAAEAVAALVLPVRIARSGLRVRRVAAATSSRMAP